MLGFRSFSVNSSGTLRRTYEHQSIAYGCHNVSSIKTLENISSHKINIMQCYIYRNNEIRFVFCLFVINETSGPRPRLCKERITLSSSLRGRRVKNQCGPKKMRGARGKETHDGESRVSLARSQKIVFT